MVAIENNILTIQNNKTLNNKKLWHTDEDVQQKENQKEDLNLCLCREGAEDYDMPLTYDYQ